MLFKFQQDIPKRRMKVAVHSVILISGGGLSQTRGAEKVNAFTPNLSLVFGMTQSPLDDVDNLENDGTSSHAFSISDK